MKTTILNYFLITSVVTLSLETFRVKADFPSLGGSTLSEKRALEERPGRNERENQAVFFRVKPEPGWYGLRPVPPVRKVTLNGRKIKKTNGLMVTTPASTSLTKPKTTATTSKQLNGENGSNDFPTKQPSTTPILQLNERSKKRPTDEIDLGIEEDDSEEGVYIGVNPPDFQDLRTTPKPKLNKTSLNLTTTKVCSSLPANSNDCEKESTCYIRCKDKACERKPFNVHSNDDSCTKLGCSGEKCFCKKSGCQRSSSDGNCWPGVIECTNLTYHKNECVLPNSFYSYGGLLCSNVEKRGHCEIARTILAINLNGKVHKDRYGIMHLPDSPSFQLDPHNSMKAGIMERMILLEFQKFDEPLYSTYIISHPIGKNKSCFTCPVIICEDGKYQLKVETLEPIWDKIGIRSFNIFLNDLPVILEADIFQLAGSQNKGVDLLVNFNVTDHTQTLTWNGRPSSTAMTNGSLKIFICPGECSATDPNFVISALSLVKLAQVPGKKDLVLKKVGEATCAEFRNEPCKCSMNGCDFSSVYGDCLTANLDCQKCGVGINSNGCVRTGVYYAHGGTVCKSFKDSGNCSKKLETVWALNLNGPNHTSSSGIIYKSDITAFNWGLVNDPCKLINPETTTDCKSMSGVLESDRKLFDGFIRVAQFSESEQLCKADRQNCVSFPVQICQDGYYELRLKLMSSSPPTSLPDQVFHVKLNNITVLHSFHFGKLAGAKTCEAVEIAVPFHVNEFSQRLLLQGHPIPSKIIGGEILLSFCMSECSSSPNNGGLEISAFAVGKYSDNELKKPNMPKSNGTCINFNNDPCGCSEARCEFNSVKRECVLRDPNGICSSCHFRPSDCRHPNSFHTIGGVICKNPFWEGSRGNCKISNVIFASSLNGRGSFNDSRGVKFTPSKGMKMNKNKMASHTTLAPFLLLEDKNADNRSMDQKATDMNMTFRQYFTQGHSASKYGTTVSKVWVPKGGAFKGYGHASKKGNGQDQASCEIYPVPLPFTGRYELSIRISVKAGLGHPITVLFNNQPIVEEFDLAMYLDPKASGNGNGTEVELNVNFEVMRKDGPRGKMILILKVFPNSPIEMDEVQLGFCNGNCGDGLNEGKEANPTSIINSISVVKLND